MAIHPLIQTTIFPAPNTFFEEVEQSATCPEPR